MRKIFYFLFILLYACVAVDLSAQQMNSNIKFRSNKTIKTIKGYYAPRFETGGGYNVLTFDGVSSIGLTIGITPSPVTIWNDVKSTISGSIFKTPYITFLLFAILVCSKLYIGMVIL